MRPKKGQYRIGTASSTLARRAVNQLTQRPRPSTRAAKEWPKRSRRKDPSGNAQASTNRLKRGRPCRGEAGGGRGTAGNPTNSKAGPCNHAAQRRNQNQQPQRSARRKHPTRTASVEGKGRTRGQKRRGEGGKATGRWTARPSLQSRPVRPKPHEPTTTHGDPRGEAPGAGNCRGKMTSPACPSRQPSVGNARGHAPAQHYSAPRNRPSQKGPASTRAGGHPHRPPKTTQGGADSQHAQANR